VALDLANLPPPAQKVAVEDVAIIEA